MLLDEESEEYNLYSKDEKHEFAFRIFQMLVLGGILCQFENALQPYLDVTKTIYKDLIRLLIFKIKFNKNEKYRNFIYFIVSSRVQKQNTSNDLFVSTLVLEIIAKDDKGQDYFPFDSSNKQNIGFLLIDANSREITTFIHQFGGYCPD